MPQRKNARKKTGSGSTSQEQMRISQRIVNVKRHTQGYVVGGRFISVLEARRLASLGRLRGVRVVGNHIQASVGGHRRLSDLPTSIRKDNSKRSK